MLLFLLLVTAAIGTVAADPGTDVAGAERVVAIDASAADAGQDGADSGEDEMAPAPDDAQGCANTRVGWGWGCSATGTGEEAPIPAVFGLIAVAGWARLRGSRRNSR